MKKRYSVCLTEIAELFPPIDPAAWMDLDLTLIRAFDTTLFSFARWQQVSLSYYSHCNGLCVIVGCYTFLCEGYRQSVALLGGVEDILLKLHKLPISEFIQCEERILRQLEIMYGYSAIYS